MIAIVDYGMGNVRSIKNALNFVGSKAIVTAEEKVLRDADALILPGVGAFPDAMENLHQKKLVPLLGDLVLSQKKPVLGICLGMQLLARMGFEHKKTGGLNWIDSEVILLDQDAQNKVPNVGWCPVKIKKSSNLFSSLADESDFYFVHSFQMICKREEDILAEANHTRPIVAAVESNNIVGVQFHPEKSQDNGLTFFENWIRSI